MLHKQKYQKSNEICLKRHFFGKDIQIIEKHLKTLNLINHPGNVTLSYEKAPLHTATRKAKMKRLSRSHVDQDVKHHKCLIIFIHNLVQSLRKTV